MKWVRFIAKLNILRFNAIWKGIQKVVETEYLMESYLFFLAADYSKNYAFT